MDDCSSDNTPEVARRLAETYRQVQTVRHSKNAGKTTALKTGFALTEGQIVIVQDADLEYAGFSDKAVEKTASGSICMKREAQR